MGVVSSARSSARVESARLNSETYRRRDAVLPGLGTDNLFVCAMAEQNGTKQSQPTDWLVVSQFHRREKHSLIVRLYAATGSGRKAAMASTACNRYPDDH